MQISFKFEKKAEIHYQLGNTMDGTCGKSSVVGIRNNELTNDQRKNKQKTIANNITRDRAQSL